jgi:hypothetical protein
MATEAAAVRTEYVKGIRGGAIWQSEIAYTYRCPFCSAPVFSQYEGDDRPIIICDGPMDGHRLEWRLES